VRQVSEGFVRLVEAIGHCVNSQRNSSGPSQELIAILSSVCRDAAEGSLFEQMALVIERRDVRQVDARNRQRSSPIECGEGNWNQGANGSKEDRRV
jgi:hypothetical protein